MTEFYTSRSAVESYQSCPRYRYNQYYLDGKGVVAKKKSVPLVTGSTVHRGVEHILNRVRIGQEVDIDTAVGLAVEEYVKSVELNGFSHKEIKSDAQQYFTYQEQKALSEGLIRAWAIAELPKLVERYKVLHVEREIVPLELGQGVMFQAKVDAEFQEIASGDYHNYSLKTAKSWGEREENSYKSDLQGCTEIWAVEEDAKRRNLVIQNMQNGCDVMWEYDDKKVKQYQDIKTFLSKRVVDKQVSGVRFCILIKGKMYKNENYPNSMAATYSPLIRGYKHFTPTSMDLAHSWTYPNPDNLSGTSKLGKGWEPFNVWESPEISIKGWIEILARQEIQPECGDIVKAQVVTPVEYWRDEEEIQIAIKEIELQEGNIRDALVLNKRGDMTSEDMLNGYFPHYRSHCNFHFGGMCEYNPLCWDNLSEEKKEKLYEIRLPHHIYERENG